MNYFNIPNSKENIPVFTKKLNNLNFGQHKTFNQNHVVEIPYRNLKTLQYHDTLGNRNNKSQNITSTTPLADLSKNKMNLTPNQSYFQYTEGGDNENMKILLARKSEECEFWKKKAEEYLNLSNYDKESHELIRNLEEKVRILIKENTKLNEAIRNQVSTNNFHFNDQNLINNLKSSFAHIEERNLNLKLEQLQQRVNDTNFELKEWKEKYDRLEKRSNQNDNAKDQAIEYQKNYFENEIVKLSNIILVKEKEIEDLRNVSENNQINEIEKKELHYKIFLLSTENERLHLLIKKIEKNKEQNKVSSLIPEKDNDPKILKDRAHLEEEVWKAKNRIKELENERFNSVQNPTRDYDKSYVGNTEFQKYIEDLNKISKEKKELIKEMDFIVSRNKLLEDEIEKYKIRLRNVEHDNQNKNQTFMSEQDYLKTTLIREKEDLQRKISDKEMIIMRQNDEIKKLIADSQNLITKETVEYQNQINEQKEIIQRLKTDIKVMENQMIQYTQLSEKPLKELTNMQERYTKVFNEKNAIESNSQELKKQIFDLKSTLESLEKEIRENRIENSELKEIARAYSKEKGVFPTLDDEIKELVRVKDELQEQIKNDYSMIKEQDGDILLMADEIQNLRNSLANNERNLKKKLEYINKLEIKVNEMSHRLKSKDNEGVPLENVFRLLGLLVIVCSELESCREQVKLVPEAKTFVPKSTSIIRESRAISDNNPYIRRSPSGKRMERSMMERSGKKAIEEIKYISRSRNQTIDNLK